MTAIAVDREFNPFSPESMNNPYPAYADLLERLRGQGFQFTVQCKKALTDLL